MDFFAHGFWSYIFFHKSKQPWIAVLFGLLPDTISWGVYLVYRLFTTGFQFGAPDLGAIPGWVFTLYGLSHSLIISFLVILIVYFMARRIAIYMLAWPIAIVLDTLTHTRDFLPTPFLWPFEWYFPGINWGTGWFMIINWGLILFWIGYIVYKKKIKKP